MKNTNIDWIGNIPNDWKIYKIGSLFKSRNEKVSDTDYPPLSVSKGGVVPQMEGVAKSDASDNRKLVLEKDFVINSRSDRKQSCGFSSLDGSVSLINTVLYTDNSNIILPEYTNIVMKNYGFAEEFYRWGHGIVADLWTTRWQEMKNIVLPIPSIDKQKKILCLLSSKLERIDNLITNQQTQIEKLKEYKQSVITEAVTKGLDKFSPMKDSGIEWIGKIPTDWDIQKIKFHIQVNNEKIYNLNLPYIALEHIEGFSGKLIETNSLYDVTDAIVANKGDVLFGKLRPYLAKVYLVQDKSYVSSEFAVFNTNTISNGYLKWFMLGYGFLDTVNASTYGTKMPRANVDFIKNLHVPIFNLREQEYISDYLDEKCDKIDRLIAIKQEKIEKLQEYKKSLIYEYVTGKKEAV